MAGTVLRCSEHRARKANVVNVRDLVNELDYNDGISPVYVNVYGHLMRIECVESQVGYTEILLTEENRVPCHDTTPTTSPAKSATEPASETKDALDALTTRLRGEGTTTESGTTEPVSSQNDSSHANHVIPVTGCTRCYYADGRLKGFTYKP